MCCLAFVEKLCIQPFIQNSSELFQKKFNLDLQETGTVIAIPFIVFILLAPMLGLFMDKIGQRCYMMIIGFICLFFSQSVFLSYETCPSDDKCYEGIMPMALIGLASTMI